MNVPPGVLRVVNCLRNAGYQAFLVGGCVRDQLLGVEPHDWDVATDAQPAQVIELFPGAIPVGAAFGTVIVLSPGPVEVTTFRRDLAYKDGRHPEGVVYSQSVYEDLWRRDFTINAMAYDPVELQMLDPTGGREDLADKLIRAVGDPEKRFREDGLRLLRAVRFSCQLGFDIAPDTWKAAEGLAHMVDKLSRERVRDELVKVLASLDPARGLWMLQELGISQRVLPELRGSERLPQAKKGAPTLLDHLVQAVAACPPSPMLRLAALLHDVGKLNTRAITPSGQVTFYGHEEESARLAGTAMRRLRFDAKSVSYVTTLIRYHMVTGPVTAKSLRRWLGAYGETWVRDLLALRRADHLASGGEETPWIDAALAQFAAILAEEGAMHLSDLPVNGRDIIQELGIAPGPVVGYLLRSLFDIVLSDPSQNERQLLLAHARRLLLSVPESAGKMPGDVENRCDR